MRRTRQEPKYAVTDQPPLLGSLIKTGKKANQQKEYVVLRRPIVLEEATIHSNIMTFLMICWGLGSP